MTTRPGPRPSVPKPPTVRLRDPVGVVAAVPYLLGFEPRRSLVVIGVDRDEGVGPTLRVDLDVVTAGQDELTATWDHVEAIMVRNGCRSVLTVVYTDVDPCDLDPARVSALLDLLLRRAGPPADGPRGRVPAPAVLDLVQVGPHRFRSLGCSDPACCPEQGAARSEARTHPVAASFVLAGRSPVADRQQTAPEDDTVTPAERATARAAAEAARRSSRGPRPGRGRAHGPRHDGTVSRQQRELFRQWSTGLPRCPGPALAGRLVAGWRDSPRLRDACLALFLPDGAQVAAALLRPDGDLGSRRLARCLADPACAGVARDGDLVLRRLAALTQGADRATVLAAHAWLSWVSGDGTAAGVLAERALAEDTAQSMAGLVGQCLDHGLGAPWTTRAPATAWADR